MKKFVIITFALFLIFLVGCSNSTSNSDSSSNDASSSEQKTETKSEVTAPTGPLTIVWYPNESGSELAGAREALGDVITAATGLEVQHRTTTDYNIAIETIANGNADLAFMGAIGYIEANIRNNAVQPLVIPSGQSGTADDAVYYGWLGVKKENADLYKDSSDYSIENIKGKKFSFVSTSSTSGFVVPANSIVSYFSQKDEWKNLIAEDLLEGGSNKLFSEVAYGNSHQGSLVNLLTNRVDVAAFCDACVSQYIELIEGEENRPGAIYMVKDNADDPFNNFPGEEFTLISVTPVLNAPIVVNKDNINDDLATKLIEALTSDEVANNTSVFVPAGSDFIGLFNKRADERFVHVNDAWFNPLRELR
ncbi:PhnD/SsuA/transferrin family substrate-binding protein [Anaerobacillus isosaccharinicus]|uniref:PhnD/SsuA/transferrin family substrate-binding protein n=1 Tax=Anaerobacillus isosaccharinicus TaxID=1532552 RepID=A0A1S2LIK9_9BACI|nr:PhnD/SsuA/transferrin family substrate-binding protein [Anaerobacillus isosaccharinicus]MBA5588331.1 PhnD/SsuA/transferrin family substrate-binding protein [Anaerobacillus isosaccharinicus]QOY38234.1 PhnD/SsuA/transferrin family substrate-binding protein [Anaerobacillus isosaccharinicus]